MPTRQRYRLRMRAQCVREDTPTSLSTRKECRLIEATTGSLEMQFRRTYNFARGFPGVLLPDILGLSICINVMLLEERCGIDPGIEIGINSEFIATMDIRTYRTGQGCQSAILTAFPVD